MSNRVSEKLIRDTYALARERYASLGVDTDAALRSWQASPISLHCWQGDDVGGFETPAASWAADWPPPATTPARPARADELRADLDKAFSLIPGRHRLNLHAIYAETGGRAVDRNEMRAGALRRLDRLGEGAWASGWTSTRRSSPIPRRPTASRCRTPTRASAGSGSSTASPAARSARVIGRDAGHALRHQRLDPRRLQGHARRPQGAARCWLEVAGRDLRRAARPTLQPRRGRGQALRHRLGELRRRLARVLPGLRRANRKLLCLDSGPLPSRPRPSPTRSRPCCCFLDEILLHVSRGVRWDSDHVVILDDELRAIAEEIVRGGYPGPRPHRAGLLRRQHQPRRGLGDRHARHAQGPAAGAARAVRPVDGA